MSVQESLIAQLIERFGTENYTDIARRAGLSGPRFAQYRAGTRSMDDDAVIGCALTLGLEPDALVKQHRVETARTARERKVWQRIATAAGLGIIAVGLTSHGHPLDNGIAAFSMLYAIPEPHALYIMRNMLRGRLRRALAVLTNWLTGWTLPTIWSAGMTRSQWLDPLQAAHLMLQLPTAVAGQPGRGRQRRQSARRQDALRELARRLYTQPIIEGVVDLHTVSPSSRRQTTILIQACLRLIVVPLTTTFRRDTISIHLIHTRGKLLALARR